MLVASQNLHIRLPPDHAVKLQSQDFVQDIVKTVLGLGRAIGLFPGQFAGNSGWVIFTPQAPMAAHPWDAAHRQSQLMATTANGRTPIADVYVEPDILHLLPGNAGPAPPPTALVAPLPPWPRRPLDGHYAPSAAELYSPAWHLAQNRFPEIWGVTQGQYIRIGHPDTGCWPGHTSTPKNLRQDLGANF